MRCCVRVSIAFDRLELAHALRCCSPHLPGNGARAYLLPTLAMMNLRQVTPRLPSLEVRPPLRRSNRAHAQCC
jgi:hypothetical protein